MPIFFITSLGQGEGEVFSKRTGVKILESVQWKERAGDQELRTQPNEAWLHHTTQQPVRVHRITLQTN